jgi:HNH endonuclease
VSNPGPAHQCPWPTGVARARSVSTAAVVGGAANVMAGLAGLMSSGSGSGSRANASTLGEKPKTGQAGGEGAGKPFPTSVKDQARAESGNKCVFCGKKTGPEPGPLKSEIDHALPKSRGGNNTIDNAQNTCRTCNRQKGAQSSEEFQVQE